MSSKPCAQIIIFGSEKQAEVRAGQDIVCRPRHDAGDVSNAPDSCRFFCSSVPACCVGAAGADATDFRTIDRADGHTIVVRPLEGGGTFEIDLTSKVAVFGVSNAKVDDIKPGAFIGVGAMPQPTAASARCR